ncbi:MAG: hypothetical protein E7566_06475 [Ruminococcaceae bacterium]|nr:hypothetical protein [Oscillospiraceae bacterium]
MKILKIIFIFLLLVVLTCSVVFVPQFISGQKEENILNEVIYLNYSAGNRPKLTSKQVARLYHNREVGVIYNSINTYSDYSDASKDLVIELIEQLFEEDDKVCSYIKQRLADGTFSFTRSSTLIKIDNQPTALNFVRCYVDDFEIFYEEKTKTILRATFDFSDKNFTDDKDYNSFIENIEYMISKYYEKTLWLMKDEYYFFVDFPKIVESEQDYYFANLFIGCGILQYDDIKAEVMYSY